MTQISSKSPSDATAHQPARETPARLITPRSVALALLLSFIGTLWVRSAELISFACQITEATPPITALTVLLFLSLCRPALRRLGGWAQLTDAELVAVYAFVTIATLMSSVGMVRLLIPSVTAPFYFATPENRFDYINGFIPEWFAPHDSETLRALYEGLDSGQSVPWSMWWRPVLFWTAFVLVLWLGALCLFTLLRRRWTDTERLSFPLLYLPLELPKGLSGQQGGKSFFRNPVMWAGFAIAALFNITNFAHALDPAIPALGRQFNLGALLTEEPWNHLRPLNIVWRPEVVGLGYLVSLEVLMSVWVMYVAERVVSMLVQMAGYHPAGFPFSHEQSAGAYVAIALLLLWAARGHLAAAWRAAIGRADDSDREEPMSYRAALIGLTVAVVAAAAVLRFAGLSLGAFCAYFFLLLCFALVYARIRAETGMPAVWAFPYYQARRAPVTILGSAPFTGGGTDLRSMTVWSSLFFLSRGYFTAVMGYPLEFFRLADEVGGSRRQMLKLLVVALAAGMLMAFWMHISLYYQYGANVLEGGTTEGGYRTRLANGEFAATAALLRTPKAPDIARGGAYLFGFLLAGGLMLARSVLLQFPIHPLGYALSSAIGSNVWAAFLFTWALKVTVLKLGGVRLYRQTLPAFLGLALGHFFTAGIVWGIVSMFYPDAASVFVVWFI